MSEVNADDFKQEKSCNFKNEHYSVRDNGAVLRHTPEGKRNRAIDNKWTFGKENTSNPYLQISGVRIHRIVATAFHGDPPDPEYVVDHIDSNCRNNRPENLRWLTRLENALKNPATRKKIEYLCGSIEAFLENPSMLNDLRGDPNFGWMRRVTPEEARNCKARMDIWAQTEGNPEKSKDKADHRISFTDGVYRPLAKWEAGIAGEPGLDFASTPWCAQYMWRGDAHFPCCPSVFESDPLDYYSRIDEYFANIKDGTVFAYSDNDPPFKLTVVESSIVVEQASILVLCKGIGSIWSIIGIEPVKKSNHFVHFLLGTYPDKEEANRAFREKREFLNFWSDGYANGRNEI